MDTDMDANSEAWSPCSSWHDMKRTANCGVFLFFFLFLFLTRSKPTVKKKKIVNFVLRQPRNLATMDIPFAITQLPGC